MNRVRSLVRDVPDFPKPGIVFKDITPLLADEVAFHFGAGFVPVRKAGKLPWKVETEEYQLEYGSAALELHDDAIAPGERVLIVDDVLATGGTARAAARLVERLGGKVVGIATLI